MPMFDLPRDQLVDYSPDLPVPDDLDEFWSATLTEFRAAAVPPSFELLGTGLTLVDTNDVIFSGFGGDHVRGWLHVPTRATGPLPAVVRYQGYGGGRALPHEAPFWTLAGCAALTRDTRGQGAGWSTGDTPDPAGCAPSHAGFMTRGILDPATYYYRRLFTDAVLAVDAVRASPLVDQARIALAGAARVAGWPSRPLRWCPTWSRRCRRAVPVRLTYRRRRPSGTAIPTRRSSAT